MRSGIMHLTRKKFVRNVFILLSGTAAAQLISLFTSPIITRLYGPENYGIMGVFLTFVVILSPIAAMSYPKAIVLTKSDSEAGRLIKLSLYIAAATAIIFFITFLSFSKWILDIFQLEGISSFLYLIPFVTLLTGFQEVIEQWLIKTKQFSVTAKVTVLHSIILQGSKVGVGFFFPFAIVLVGLSALSTGLKVVMMAAFAKKSGNVPVLKKKESFGEYQKIAVAYKDFPIYRTPQLFVSAISQNLPILLLTGFFGPASAGFYAIGKTVLGMPVQLVGKSVGDVFYPRINDAAKKGENLTPLIYKATLALSLIGIVPFGAVVVFGPELFSFAFGADWARAGDYARWIAIWYFTSFINRPSLASLPVLSVQGFHLIYTIIMLAACTLALAAGYFLFSSDVAAIAFFGITGALMNMGLILITSQISRKYDEKHGGLPFL